MKRGEGKRERWMQWVHCFRYLFRQRRIRLWRRNRKTPIAGLLLAEQPFQPFAELNDIHADLCGPLVIRAASSAVLPLS